MESDGRQEEREIYGVSQDALTFFRLSYFFIFSANENCLFWEK
jgi:hypothetical protein